MSRYRSLVIDVDSTLCDIEGIDWLAGRGTGDTAERVAKLTDRAMNGEIPLESVYEERLRIVNPSRASIDKLADAYRERVAPGARDVMRALRADGVRVVLVSGGIRQAIQPLATELDAELCAVDLRFGAGGRFEGVEASPLRTQRGKLDVVSGLGLARPSLAVGDGITDAAMGPAVDRFVAYTGFVRRPAVVAVADGEIRTFEELLRLMSSAD